MRRGINGLSRRVQNVVRRSKVKVGRSATDITGRTYALRVLPIGARKAVSTWPWIILEARAREAPKVF